MAGVAAQVIAMADPAERIRKEMLDKIMPMIDRSGFRPTGPDILVAMFNRADRKSAGGIIVPGTNREDEFQGKIGLVIALGPLCSDAKSPGYADWFGGQPPVVGDWVGMKVADGLSLLVGDTMCRLVEWRYIRCLCAVPDLVM